MADEPEQDFKILEALAAIQDVGDFRLRELMANLGLNPNQPIIFYRQLIKEAREVISYIDLLEQSIDGDARAMAKQKATLLARDEQVMALTAKLRSLQDGTHIKSESLEKERQGLQAKVLRYDAMTKLLKGEIKPPMLKAISELYYDIYTDAVNAVIYGQSPPDPTLLEKARQMLSQQLRDILRIPQEQLEQEMEALRAENEKLQKNNEILAILYDGLRQQGWVDTPPGETERGGG